MSGSSQRDPATAHGMQQVIIEEGIDHQRPVIKYIINLVSELEHQGMEPGAYSVSMAQYIEVALDIIRAIDSAGPFDVEIDF